MDQRERVQQLCEDHAEDLRSLAINVAEHRQWDLTLPVAVIDARSDRRRFHVTAVGTIGNLVRVSTTIDHPLMQQLFELIQTRSDDSALHLMLSNADYGEEFAATFEMYREERSGGAPLWFQPLPMAHSRVDVEEFVLGLWTGCMQPGCLLIGVTARGGVLPATAPGGQARLYQNCRHYVPRRRLLCSRDIAAGLLRLEIVQR